MSQPTVYMGQPCYGYTHPDSGRVFWQGGARGNTYRRQFGTSLLGDTFNFLRCECLNMQTSEQVPADQKPTVFAMLHGDVVPRDHWWVEILTRILYEQDADMVSAVIPLKDRRGVTSTAIPLKPDIRHMIERRLTMAEVMQLPETFSAADVGFPDRALLVNTGCWACRTDREWWFDSELCFNITSRIIKLPGGAHVARGESEDWHWSRELHKKGCKVLATRAVSVDHYGPVPHPNDVAWGLHPTDYESIGYQSGLLTLPSLAP